MPESEIDKVNAEWVELYADSQKKWEEAYNKLEYTLIGVMHSVDKWLEGDELEQDEVNRAATMREKTLRLIENAETEVAREIFEEVDSMLELVSAMIGLDIIAYGGKYAELKKKYTEGDK